MAVALPSGFRRDFPVLKFSVGCFRMHHFRISRGKILSVASKLEFYNDAIQSTISIVTLFSDRKNPKIRTTALYLL